MKADTKIWLSFLDFFNGSNCFPDQFWSSDLHLFTDSAGGSHGCAAYLEPHWSVFKWPANWANTNLIRDITFLELIPISLAFMLWSHKLQGKKLLLHTDNLGLVSILNKKSSKSKRVMHLIRPLVLNSLMHNIQFKAIHIVGKDNGIADALSRQQWDRFRYLAPRADEFPSAPPDGFLSTISNIRPGDY